MRIFLSELFYCSLTVYAKAQLVSGLTTELTIMRNSDNKFLNTSTSTWASSEYNISLTEVYNGVYNIGVKFSDYSNKPDTYTLIYKFNLNGVDYSQVEQIQTERKNRSKMV